MLLLLSSSQDVVVELLDNIVVVEPLDNVVAVVLLAAGFVSKNGAVVHKDSLVIKMG